MTNITEAARHLPSRRERRAAQTRAAILSAARELFDKQGFVETTVDQIAERADVAPRTFFRYFESKEALLFAPFDELQQTMFAALEARPVGEHPLRSLVLTFTAIADDVEARHADLEWGYQMCLQHEVFGVYEREMTKTQVMNRIASFVADRLGVEVEADPRPLAWTAVVLISFGSVVKSTLSTGGGRIAEVFATLLAQTVASLADALDDSAAADAVTPAS